MSLRKERKPEFQTSSRIPVDAVYTPDHIQGLDPSRDLGVPGDYPFTRGVYDTMYRGKLWTMRQYAGFGTAEESNKRYRFLLEQGQTGLSIAFDLPTQLGLDSDHELSRGEIGKVGVAIDTLEDMEILFRDIPLNKVSVSMTINATASILLAMYLALAEMRKIAWTELSGTIQNDVLKEYIARGTYIYPPRPSLRITMDILAFCQEHVPNWNTMSISGYHIREAGANAVQELAFTLANAVTYVQTAVEAGLDVDSIAPRLSFFLASSSCFFEEVAKFRAARRLWARLMKERFQAKNLLSWKFRFHTQTSGVTLQAKEPENNVVRVALQALAAVMGGTQSLHTNSRDEALALPTEESVQIALRTQQIIAHESGVADTADPLGGSFFVESLTNRIEDAVLEYLEKIDDMGGMLPAVEQGYIQKEIQESAYRHQRMVEREEQIIVGLNAFTADSESAGFGISTPPEKVEKGQIERLAQFKSGRDPKSVSTSLDGLKRAARGGDNLILPILEAVKASVTLGEISSGLQDVFGIHKERINF